MLFMTLMCIDMLQCSYLGAEILPYSFASSAYWPTKCFIILSKLFNRIHFHTVIVKIQENTNKCNILHFKLCTIKTLEVRIRKGRNMSEF
jgi:hypothetical protein